LERVDRGMCVLYHALKGLVFIISGLTSPQTRARSSGTP
jgi:hypothetical protein